MPLTHDDVLWNGDLPIVLVTTEAGELVKISQGEGAEARAAEWIGDRPELQPVTFDIFDERCPHCNRPFWHEAVSGSEEEGWYCPACDGRLWKKVSEQTTVSSKTPAYAELQSWLTALANEDVYLTDSAQENYEAAEQWWNGVRHVMHGVEKLEREAMAYLRHAEEVAEDEDPSS